MTSDGFVRYCGICSQLFFLALRKLMRQPWCGQRVQVMSCWSPHLTSSQFHCTQCCSLEAQQIAENSGGPLCLQTHAWLIFVVQSRVPWCHSLLFCTLLLFQILSKQFSEEEKGEFSPRWCPRARAPCHLCSSLLGGHLTTEWRSDKQRDSSISVMVWLGREREATWCLPTVTTKRVLGMPWGRRMAVRRFRCLQPLIKDGCPGV